jgi:hypothetical protein
MDKESTIIAAFSICNFIILLIFSIAAIQQLSSLKDERGLKMVERCVLKAKDMEAVSRCFPEGQP